MKQAIIRVWVIRTTGGWRISLRNTEALPRKSQTGWKGPRCIKWLKYFFWHSSCWSLHFLQTTLSWCRSPGWKSIRYPLTAMMPIRATMPWKRRLPIKAKSAACVAVSAGCLSLPVGSRRLHLSISSSDPNREIQPIISYTWKSMRLSFQGWHPGQPLP